MAGLAGEGAGAGWTAVVAVFWLPERAASTAAEIEPSSCFTTELMTACSLETWDTWAVTAGTSATGLGTVWPVVPTLVQALHSPTEPELEEELELENEELDSLELEELENWPVAPGRGKLPEVETLTAGPWVKVPWKFPNFPGVLTDLVPLPPRAAWMAASMGPSSWERMVSTRAEVC